MSEYSIGGGYPMCNKKVQVVDNPDPAWQGGQDPYTEGNSK